MKFAQDIILTPVITENSMDLARNQKKYTFKVAGVNVINCDGEKKRRLHPWHHRFLQESHRHPDRRLQNHRILRRFDVRGE